MAAVPHVAAPAPSAMPSRNPDLAATGPDAPGADLPADPLGAERADLFFCLAAAFRPPPAQMSARDWSLPLAADLQELGAALGLDTAAAARTLRALAAERDTDEPWLVDYSRLFLVPPVPVTLNTGLYLEGSIGGSSAQMLQQCYGTAGFAMQESFRDLPDHVAVQLEFIAALLQRAEGGDADVADMAREFADSFVSHWVRPLRDACERSAGRNQAALVYVAVVDVLQQAVDPALF
jgi:TorA maturation chaperone TorD